MTKTCESCGKEFVNPDMQALGLSEEQQEEIREAALLAQGTE